MAIKKQESETTIPRIGTHSYPTIENDQETRSYWNVAGANLLVETYLKKKDYLETDHNVARIPLGSGVNGPAFLTKSGTVLKFTPNSNEAASSLIIGLLGRKLKSQARVFKVYQIEEPSRTFWIIEKEYVTPIDDYLEDEGVEYDREIQTAIYYAIRKKFKTYEQFKKWMFGRVKDEIEKKTLEKLFRKKEKFMRSVYDFYRIILEDEKLSKENLDFQDIHMGNVGTRGHRLLCFDCVHQSGFSLKRGGLTGKKVKIHPQTKMYFYKATNLQTIYKKIDRLLQKTFESCLDLEYSDKKEFDGVKKAKESYDAIGKYMNLKSNVFSLPFVDLVYGAEKITSEKLNKLQEGLEHLNKLVDKFYEYQIYIKKDYNSNISDILDMIDNRIDYTIETKRSLREDMRGIYDSGGEITKDVSRNISFHDRKKGYGKIKSTNVGDAIEEVADAVWELAGSKRFLEGGMINWASEEHIGKDPRLEKITREDLDPFEQSTYDTFKKHGHGFALQVIINSMEGDYSQLSPKLAEIAVAQDAEMGIEAKHGRYIPEENDHDDNDFDDDDSNYDDDDDDDKGEWFTIPLESGKQTRVYIPSKTEDEDYKQGGVFSILDETEQKLLNEIIAGNKTFFTDAETDALYTKLLGYYADEMPYGIAKARTGDPDLWILERIGQESGNRKNGGKIEKGKIENQYRGKTAPQIWNEWSPNQRIHFLLDHDKEINETWKRMGNKITELNSEKWYSNLYEELPEAIRQSLTAHILLSQYGKGGGVDPSARPPKKWYEKMTREIKSNNPSYSKQQVRQTIGDIWYHKLSHAKRSEIRKREGKHYVRSRKKEGGGYAKGIGRLEQLKNRQKGGLTEWQFEEKILYKPISGRNTSDVDFFYEEEFLKDKLPKGAIIDYVSADTSESGCFRVRYENKPDITKRGIEATKPSVKRIWGTIIVEYYESDSENAEKQEKEIEFDTDKFTEFIHKNRSPFPSDKWGYSLVLNKGCVAGAPQALNIDFKDKIIIVNFTGSEDMGEKEYYNNGGTTPNNEKIDIYYVKGDRVVSSISTTQEGAEEALKKHNQFLAKEIGEGHIFRARVPKIEYHNNEIRISNWQEWEPKYRANGMERSFQKGEKLDIQKLRNKYGDYKNQKLSDNGFDVMKLSEEQKDLILQPSEAPEVYYQDGEITPKQASIVWKKSLKEYGLSDSDIQRAINMHSKEYGGTVCEQPLTLVENSELMQKLTQKNSGKEKNDKTKNRIAELLQTKSASQVAKELGMSVSEINVIMKDE